MTDFKELGRINREKIIDYLATVGTWATVKRIQEGTRIPDNGTVYTHCHNLTREGVLIESKIEIMGKMIFVYMVNLR
jgi:hypothetical protein